MLYSYDKDTDQFIPAGDLGGGGLVGLKGTATATGDWTITGLVPGKPLFITVSGTTTSTTLGAILHNVTGVLNPWDSGTTGLQLGSVSESGSIDNSSNAAIFIPSATEVTINVYAISNATLSAYQ